MAKQKSDLSRAFSEDGANKTLIAGVMMRGKYNWAVGLREPDGAIYEEQHDLSSGQTKNGWMYWPLVRGCRAMVESLVLGYKALEIRLSMRSTRTKRTLRTLPPKMALRVAGLRRIARSKLSLRNAMALRKQRRTRTAWLMVRCRRRTSRRSRGRTISADPIR